MSQKTIVTGGQVGAAAGETVTGLTLTGSMEGSLAAHLLQEKAILLRSRVRDALFRNEEPQPLPRDSDEPGVIDAAIALEQALGDRKNTVLIAALEKMLHLDEKNEGTGQPSLAEKIFHSLELHPERTEFRGDIDDDTVLELLSLAETRPKMAGLIRRMVHARKQMKQLLEAKDREIAEQHRQLTHDRKFPALLTNSALQDALDTDPLNNSGLFVFGDVSDFKSVNDTYGMAFVDKTLLFAIANAFSPSAFGRRTVCDVLSSRVDGDEIVVFFRGAVDELAAARLYAAAFRHAVQGISYHFLDDRWSDLSPRVRKPVDDIDDARQREGTRKQVLEMIQSRFASMQCKMGVVPRAGTAAQTQSGAEALMNGTKPYKKDVPFPVIIGSDPTAVWSALEGNRMPMDGREGKPGDR